ncbi:pollen-specific leucine-rich repeat extensin-like protein 1 [Cocos nucifera]|uniref:Pollen-specific leucine-rich repeat extensin-like protein 1 n=1 Tax=Cocos nucifera TaxID=13894 RepID=A0A8K0HT47_COCNU|nr:pollen-specific leucine-rich repeat extensin-like protein 1 [Cocos nucifera]
MEIRKSNIGLLLLYISISTTFLTQCGARGLRQPKSSPLKSSRKLRMARHFELYPSASHVIHLPYCVSPPLNPLPPSTNIPTPTLPIQSSPPSPTSYSPVLTPNPPETVPSPPTCMPGPPEYEISPPSYVPSPPEFVPEPPLFEPPVVYPPPLGPPPPPGALPSLWCVAKPTVPDPIIREAMEYACGFGTNCGPIQPNGECYQPDTVLAHASYAFNSYWQQSKAAGGTCDFGGTAILVTSDPSYEACHFNLT